MLGRRGGHGRAPAAAAGRPGGEEGAEGHDAAARPQPDDQRLDPQADDGGVRARLGRGHERLLGDFLVHRGRRGDSHHEAVGPERVERQPDGEQFVIIPGGTVGNFVDSMNVVINWTEELKRRVLAK